MPREGNVGRPPNSGGRPLWRRRCWIGAATLCIAAALAGAWLLRAKGLPASAAQTTPSQAVAAPEASGPLATAPVATPTQAAATPTASGPLASADDVQRIAPLDAKALIDQGRAVLYDVRSAESYQAGHAAGAISLPEDQIQARLSTLPKDKILILYCT